jgi:multidrug efflux pump subunit AcrB
MNFSAWSIRNPIAPILGFIILMVLGIQSFFSLPITKFPNIDVPLIAISVVQSGAAPAELETQVTRKVEDAVASVSGVKHISSTVNDGQSTTVVEFNMDVPTQTALNDTKDAVDRVRGNLPSEIEAPIVSKIEVEGQAILSYAVSSPGMTMEELSWYVDDTVMRALRSKPGIGRIDRYGGADREVRITLDPVKLDSYGTTASAVNAQLRATNANIGSGRSKLGDGEQAIRTLGDAQSAQGLSDMTIALTSGRHVRLGDLGTVTDTYEELRSFSRFNGVPVVSFGIFRAKGASEVSVSETVEAIVDQLRKDHPDIKINKVDDAVYYTYGNYESALHTLLEGALLAVIVVMLFLKNWRATAISAIALPLSAIPTFYIMDLLGFSLNLVSFLALTLATGILVDDAIVEIENIARHIRMGKTPYRAAIEAADEIGLAVIATTMTIVAVFVPVSFMPGIPGQYFRQFGLTVAIAVLFSLLVARLITPLMAAYLMRSKDANLEHGNEDGRLMRGYLWFVHHTLNTWRIPALGINVGNYYLTLAAALVILAILSGRNAACSGKLHAARGCVTLPDIGRTADRIVSGRYRQTHRRHAQDYRKGRWRGFGVHAQRIVSERRSRPSQGSRDCRTRQVGPVADLQGGDPSEQSADPELGCARCGCERTCQTAERDRGRGFPQPDVGARCAHHQAERPR